MAKDLLSQILDIVALLLGGQKQAPQTVSQPAPIMIPSVNKTEPPVIELDWSKQDCKISSHFTIKDAIYLPTWKRLANKEDGLDEIIKENSVKLFKAMDIVRDHFGKPIRVHVSYRPTEYNKAIGGSLKSQHSVGLACDFDVIGMSCDDVRKNINDNNLLETWAMRMEDAPGSNWVHLDLKPLEAGMHRFFKP